MSQDDQMSAAKLHREIRERAYYRYLNRVRNDTPGDSMTDWLGAEWTVKIEEMHRHGNPL